MMPLVVYGLGGIHTHIYTRGMKVIIRNQACKYTERTGKILTNWSSVMYQNIYQTFAPSKFCAIQLLRRAWASLIHDIRKVYLYLYNTITSTVVIYRIPCFDCSVWSHVSALLCIPTFTKHFMQILWQNV